MSYADTIRIKLLIQNVMDFAAAIRDARTSSGLTQSELAQKAGVSLHAVWEIESRGNGSVALLTSVCAALDLRFAGLPRGTTFAEQVRILRTRRGWSQERLAGRAGVSIPAIVRLERGNARIATLSAVLSVLAPKARARKPEIANWGQGSRDERFTSADFLEKVVSVIGPISLDPCGHRQSKVVADRYLFVEDDGLGQPWVADSVYVNPPYSATGAFVRKAHREWEEGRCKVVFALLPVQTHHLWFHEAVVGSADVFFLKGKLTFDRLGQPNTRAPFANLIALYGGDEAMIERLLAIFDCVHLPRMATLGGKREIDGSTTEGSEAKHKTKYEPKYADQDPSGEANHPQRNPETLLHDPDNCQQDDDAYWGLCA
ncbi:DNA N-6-adenine-methyltransferase [Microvirga sp. M2]|uniref:DNA N-6-adenine-methyltransferase n=1 Tax=Microvirga sp. M2 TaxID=3073270 RepID=UPI0039C34714